MEDYNETLQTKKRKKNKKIISFDNEIITKSSASTMLANIIKKDEVNENVKEKKRKQIEETLNNHQKNKVKKRKKERNKLTEATEETGKIEENTKAPKRKKKKKLNASTPAETNDQDGDEEKTSEDVMKDIKQKKESESRRAQKRKKHNELQEAKKLKSLLVSQENTLNYLSKWKHSRNDWKFEKLKQIWLTQNLFDVNKVPEEFWQTTVEYFSESKGFIRKVILRDALKIIEQEEKKDTEENGTEENVNIDLKLKRARDIVQSLQD